MDSKAESAATGIAGLDDILRGGLARGRVFLLEGSPGTGKTTIATQFLRAGAEAGETGLYITLSETEDELRASAASHGWSLDGIDIFELVPPESLLDEDQQQSLLYSSDLELGETTRRIFEAFERLRPDRVVLDSLSEIRLLAQSSLRYRRQILALKHYFARQKTTVLLLDDLTTELNDKTVHSVAHGVFGLEELARDYGPERRRLRVVKYRGRRYRGGYHDFSIETGGVWVFPRLVAAEHRKEFERTALPTQSKELNALLGGGLERGSSVLIIGPAGTGKSLLALTFVAAAAARGEHSAMFVFDEEMGLLFARAKELGIDIQALIDGGHLTIEQVDAAELTPGELSARVRRCVEKHGALTIVIDSLNGYQAAMPEENALILHMHELLQYLNRQGATTFLTVAQHGLVGDMKSPVDVTYLADTVILLRYFEALGRVRRAISVVKKRTGAHEDTIREYRIGSTGISLGAPLTEFQGVLRGVPTMVGGKGETAEDAAELIPEFSERALILAPSGRDAPIAGAILAESGIRAVICGGIDGLLEGMEAGAGFGLVTEEAFESADLRALSGWIEGQPEWSDFPFILLTRRGGGLERNPAAGRFLDTLGNVTFLERPFHPTTLVSLAQSALRGRRRQYEARARLEALHELTGSLEQQVAERTAALSAGEARLRAIFETNYQYQGLLAPDGTLLDANQTSLQGIEAKLEDVIGSPFWETRWFSDNFGLAERVRAAVAAVAEGATIREELLVDLPIGRRSFDFGMRPILDETGAVIAIVPEAVDITERRQAEEALRESQKLEAMGQLTGGVAHDFNNLLTPIIGSLDMLQRNQLGNERERRLIDGALQSAERARTLVQRLLAFARRQPLQPRAVDMAALVDGMGNLIASTSGPQIKVVIEAPGDLPSAKADPNQLEMALLNLSVNARDAMPDGGTLRITVSSETLGPSHPARLSPGRYIRLSVADTGIGMDQATIARAVEPFFSTKGIGKGTGLGLSMVHGLASQLGGALTISSRPEFGTNIDLWLPVSLEEAVPEERATPADLDSGLKGTALLVDDEELVRASTAHMLGELGYRVIETASADEALRQIDSGAEIDLLVTDYLMPGTNGADLAREVEARRPGLPLLIISGYADAEGIAPDLPRLTKPFRRDELAAKIGALGQETGEFVQSG